MWVVTRTGADAHVQEDIIADLSPIGEALNEFFDQLPPAPYESEDGAIRYDLPRITCGACTDNSSVTSLTSDGRFSTRFRLNVFDARCHFDPGEARLFHAWMVAHGMRHVVLESGEIDSERDRASYRLWRDVVAGPCLASWGYPSNFIDPIGFD